MCTRESAKIAEVRKMGVGCGGETLRVSAGAASLLVGGDVVQCAERGNFSRRRLDPEAREYACRKNLGKQKFQIFPYTCYSLSN